MLILLGLKHSPASVDETPLRNEPDVRGESDGERRIGPDDFRKLRVGENRPPHNDDFGGLFPYAVGNGLEISHRLGPV
jgi:hypothetical protein